jgi:hypothetical protein
LPPLALRKFNTLWLVEAEVQVKNMVAVAVLVDLELPRVYL